ncbi:MAG: RluA family pseudouridine synthase [Planctomycetia bacterium]|nr:RluA family pseudouridine synthase [Planctomycetia bacterium]
MEDEATDQVADEATTDQPIHFTVEPAEAGWRLDAFLAHHFPDYSRVYLRRLIVADGVTVDGSRLKVAYRLKAGQRVQVIPGAPPRESPRPEDIPLDVIYDDEQMAAINKPTGMVVHPARGHWSGTLASALAFRFGNLSGQGGPTRPGIVHRLDRDTTGVILVAKNDQVHAKLADQFQNRTVEKEYFAIVLGAPQYDRDEINHPIGVHPHQRDKMAVRHDHPTTREATTFYEVIERFKGFTALRLVPRTGRTHQIRVHLASIGCAVLCDRLYGGRADISRGELRGGPADGELLLTRQALHARRLRIIHPTTGQPLELVAPLPADLEATLSALRDQLPVRGR